MSKYGLNLRVPPSQKKKAPRKPLIAPIAGFHDDDDGDNVERDISRQATRSRALHDPRYNQAIIKKTEERQRQHEVVLERKLAKEVDVQELQKGKRAATIENVGDVNKDKGNVKLHINGKIAMSVEGSLENICKLVKKLELNE